MSQGPELRTPRMLLRRWQESDLDPLAAMSADPIVMRFFPAALSREESAALIERAEVSFEHRGFGLWALEITGETSLAGFVGLAAVEPDMPFAPAVEVGWRLASRYWGGGFATEGATEAIRFAFEDLGLPSLVSFTAAVNARSRRVMERLCMTRDPDEDFDHPRVHGHRLAPHVLYRADASAWPLCSNDVRALHQHRGA